MNKASETMGPIIMVGDDDPNHSELILRSLRNSGCQLVSAQNGEEVLVLLRTMTVHPNVILMDINMPRMGGFEALAEIRSDPKLKGIPVIMLTTSGADRDKQKAEDLHADGFLVKPGDFVVLKSYVMGIKNQYC